jgi:hypothetical protein
MRFNLKKLNDVEVKEEYQIKISNRFAALENLNDYDVDIIRAWENFGENIKALVTESVSCYELKHHRPWFDEECLKLIDQRRQAKLQWLQNTCQTT